MTAKSKGVKVAISNRQRRLKIDASRLAEITEYTLQLVDDCSTQLSIVLVDDAAIAKLNATYHNTPGPTDILSFDYGEGQGELVISVEHAVAQAKRFHTTPAHELVLYVVHGVLHLHGHDDLTRPRRRKMRIAEGRLMSQLCKCFTISKLIARRAAKQ